MRLPWFLPLPHGLIHAYRGLIFATIVIFGHFWLRNENNTDWRFIQETQKYEENARFFKGGA